MQTDTWSYEAFGTTVLSPGSDKNSYRFAGESYVGGVGMYQNRARWLDTRTGRFVSVDPAEGEDEEPISLHSYSYAQDSPGTLTDATGESAEYTIAGLARSVGVYFASSALAFAAGNGVTKGTGVLVVYGWPPPMIEVDESDNILKKGKTVWKYIPKYHRKSLEGALARDVGAQLGVKVATVRPAMNTSAMDRAIKSGSFNTVIYVGHSWGEINEKAGGLMPDLSVPGRSPSRGHIISGSQFANMLLPSVKRVHFLWCESDGVAAEAKLAKPNVEFIGGGFNADWDVEFVPAEFMRQRLVHSIWFRGIRLK